MQNKLYNNRYRKIKEIGVGAYGKINLAEDTKMPHKPDTEGEDSTARFVALKKLKLDVSRV